MNVILLRFRSLIFPWAFVCNPSSSVPALHLSPEAEGDKQLTRLYCYGYSPLKRVRKWALRIDQFKSSASTNYYSPYNKSKYSVSISFLKIITLNKVQQKIKTKILPTSEINVQFLGCAEKRTAGSRALGK